MRTKLILLPLVAATLTVGSTLASAQGYLSDPPGWRYQKEKNIEASGYDSRGGWYYAGRPHFGYRTYGYVPDGYAAYGYAPDAYVSFGFAPGFRHRHWGW